MTLFAGLPELCSLMPDGSWCLGSHCSVLTRKHWLTGNYSWTISDPQYWGSSRVLLCRWQDLRGVVCPWHDRSRLWEVGFVCETEIRVWIFQLRKEERKSTDRQCNTAIARTLVKFLGQLRDSNSGLLTIAPEDISAVAKASGSWLPLLYWHKEAIHPVSQELVVEPLHLADARESPSPDLLVHKRT